MKSKIMYIDPGGGLSGENGIIGMVSFSKTGKTLRYKDDEFKSLDGQGYKANYYHVETGEWYWISGPRKDGNDALYPKVVDIDEDAREDYWCTIRNLPELKDNNSYRCKGKYSKRMPHPELCIRGTTRK
jgi:hypothetical protein